MKGVVVVVFLSERKGQAKTPVEKATLRAGYGLEGDAHAGEGHRQVSLLADADIEEMRRRGLELDYGAFGENLVVNGLELNEIGLGSRLRLGSTAEVIISQIGKVCHTPCAIYYQAGDCIMPRLGVFARCERGGEVSPGDEIVVLERVSRQTVVLTISDRCARGETEDTAGPAAAQMLHDRLGAHIYRRAVIPDERGRIEDILRHYSDGHSIDIILTVGGTGFAPRDVTPEATRAVVERLAPGLEETMRAASLRVTPHAMLSRGVSGIRGSTLIVNLPGSERAARGNLETILPAIPHAVEKLRGSPVDCGRP